MILRVRMQDNQATGEKATKKPPRKRGGLY